MHKRLLIVIAALLISPTLSLGASDNIIIDSQGESRKEAGVGAVKFPARASQENDKCAACHPKIFVAELGANKVTMRANMNGEFCGSPNCHNGMKAFPLYECDKCHVSTK